MTNGSNPKRVKRIEAIILIADIENSSFLAETIPPREYDRVIREYHRIASRAVDEYSPAGIHKKGILAKRAYGDEILVLFHYQDLVEILTFVLNLAVFLEVEWSSSRFNTRQIRENKSPFRLRIGIGQGMVTLAQSVWDQGLTPEGYSITITKRIESRAGGGLNEPHILVAGSLKSILKKIRGIEIGQSIQIPENTARGTKSIEAVRLKSYVGLFNEFKQRIKIRDGYLKWFTRGYHALSAGDYKEAYRCNKLAIKYRSHGVAALNNLATILIGQGNLLEAETTLRKALKMKKGYETAALLNNLGSVLNRQGKFEEAEGIFRKAIRENSDNPLSHYNLGTAQFLLNNIDEAEVALKRAIELNPDYAYALNNLAEVREAQKRYDEALQLAQRALELEPDNKEIITLVKRLQKLIEK